MSADNLTDQNLADQNFADQNQPSAEVLNPAGDGNFVFVCEHASHRIPLRYKNLGLDATAQRSHAAWDPGARAVALGLANQFNSPLVASTVSRLVYDCNRPPTSPGAFSGKSELIEIVANQTLTQAQKDQRTRFVYEPFRRTLSDSIDQQTQRSGAPILATIHSFTPTYFGEQRETELGILHDSDTRFADQLLAVASAHTTLVTHRNEPYGPDDGVTHTLQEHALPRGLANVMIEIRNDLLRDDEGINTITSTLTAMINAAIHKH